jgi:methylenetetrahydrofolate reductase (NADPH)
MNDLNLSFEFFPPRSDAQQRRFWHTLGCLETLNPSYLSMTWGALGSASQASLDILEPLLKETKVPVTAHLSCAGQTSESMLNNISTLEQLGITRFLALRGDLGTDKPAIGALTHASDLVTLLAESGKRDISVAAYPEAHPESASSSDDIHWLKHKLDAGAQRAITQFFFEAETFLRFRDRAQAAGITQTLVPGILPIHDIAKVQSFSAKCGASVSTSLVQRFEKAITESSKAAAAIEHSVELCNELRREGVRDFHIYTLNQAPLSYALSCGLMGKSRAVDVAA